MVTDSYYENLAVTPCVTLAKAKKHLKLSASNTYEDDLIQGFIDAATADRENYINRSINTCDYILEVSQFENVSFAQNYDNDTVSKVEYYAPGETEIITLPEENYKLRSGVTVGTKTITFKNTIEAEKRADAVKITIRQGWKASEVPAPIVQSVLLLVADMYERREDRGEIGTNRAADALARAYRKY